MSNPVGWRIGSVRFPKRQNSSSRMVESLESRVLLSVTPQTLMADGYVPVVWQGAQIYARPGEWIVQVDGLPGKAAQQLQAVNRRLAGAGADLHAIEHLGSSGLFLMNAPRGLAQAQLAKSLRGVAGFRYVEPNSALWTSATTPNDPSFAQQWALNNTGQTGGTADADIDAPEAWDTARGNGTVIVGVIDSGVDYSHPDLAGVVWINPGEIAGNGLDDDGNGFVDDIRGWDFANSDNNPMDDNGHGTHVSGTIAALGNNSLGVAGVNWNARVMALKFLGADGSGSLADALAAVNYATMMRNSYSINVRVTNNSWNGGSYSSALYDAISRSGDAGMLFMAAAGNGGANGKGFDIDSKPVYPASYNLDNVIAVAATDSSDALASFSNYGVTGVDLAAPGVSVLSTTLGSGYGLSSGTSMATPHVAGVAALAWSYRPVASYAMIRDAILNGTDAKASLAGKLASGGRLNAFGTLLQLTTAPAAPSGVMATAISASSTHLAWTDNSSDETGFKVERAADSGFTQNLTLVTTTAANVTGYNNTGLAANTTYYYRVRATNLGGDSANSNTVGPVMPLLQINGDQGASGQSDQIRVARKASNFSLLDVFVNSGTPTYSVDFASLHAISINGLGGDDTLTLDLANGEAIPAGGMSYDGGTQTIGDSLIITGSSGDDAIAFATNQVTINSGVAALAGVENRSFSGAQQLGSLTLAGGSHITLPEGGQSTLVVRTLSVDATSSLDVADNAIIVDYTGTSPLAAIYPLLAVSAGNGWSGNGIISHTAAAGGSEYVLGIADNSSLNLTTFGGQSVDATSVLIRFTYAGDANLDGQVDLTDLSILAGSWQMAGRQWSQGDSDYSGLVDLTDLSLLAGNWQRVLPTPAAAEVVTAVADLLALGNERPGLSDSGDILG